MLCEYFLDASDIQCKFVSDGLAELKKLDFLNSLPSMFLSVSSLSSQFEVGDDDSVFELEFYTISENIFRVTVYNKNSTRNNCEYYFSKTQLISFDSTIIDEHGDSVSWKALCTDKNIILSTGESIKYCDIEEDLFQYDVICPFARLLLEFTKSV